VSAGALWVIDRPAPIYNDDQTETAKHRLTPMSKTPSRLSFHQSTLSALYAVAPGNETFVKSEQIKAIVPC